MRKKLTEEPIELINEQHAIPKKAGNGVLRYYQTVDAGGKLLRYSLAYINFNICAIDNGRVIGYDNDHNHHHKHCMGNIEPVNFKNFQVILEAFEQEWREFHEKNK